MISHKTKIKSGCACFLEPYSKELPQVVIIECWPRPRLST
ncbi:Uncharacterised protein [Vibrio cholerae]|nr:Uncharacterised protein [Vibrio cholerae]